MDYVLPHFDDRANTIGLPTGVYTLNLQARDDVGNRREPYAHSLLQLDNTAPVADVRYTGPSTVPHTRRARIGTSTRRPGVIGSSSGNP